MEDTMLVYQTPKCQAPKRYTEIPKRGLLKSTHVDGTTPIFVETDTCEFGTLAVFEGWYFGFWH